MSANIVDDHRDARPTAFLQPGDLHPVMPERLRRCVPFHAFVLCDHHRMWPGEVHAPELSAPIDDLVLQFRRRKSAIEEDEPSYTLQRRLWPAVDVLEQFAGLHD